MAHASEAPVPTCCARDYMEALVLPEEEKRALETREVVVRRAALAEMKFTEHEARCLGEIFAGEVYIDPITEVSPVWLRNYNDVVMKLGNGNHDAAVRALLQIQDHLFATALRVVRGFATVSMRLQAARLLVKQSREVYGAPRVYAYGWTTRSSVNGYQLTQEDQRAIEGFADPGSRRDIRMKCDMINTQGFPVAFLVTGAPAVAAAYQTSRFPGGDAPTAGEIEGVSDFGNALLRGFYGRLSGGGGGSAVEYPMNPDDYITVSMIDAGQMDPSPFQHPVRVMSLDDTGDMELAQAADVHDGTDELPDGMPDTPWDGSAMHARTYGHDRRSPRGGLS